MKLHGVAVLSLLALASANPIAESDHPAAVLQKRDKWCRVFTGDGNVACRRGAGTGYEVVRRISSTDRFGVNCKAYGQTIGGTR